MKTRLTVWEVLRDCDLGQCLCNPGNACCHGEAKLRTPCPDQNCHHFIWWDKNRSRYVDELDKDDNTMLNLLRLLYL